MGKKTRRNRRPGTHRHTHGHTDTHTHTLTQTHSHTRCPPQRGASGQRRRTQGEVGERGGPEGPWRLRLRLQAWAVAQLVSSFARKRARFISSPGSDDVSPKPSLLIFIFFPPSYLRIAADASGHRGCGQRVIRRAPTVPHGAAQEPPAPLSPGPRGQADAGVLVSCSCLFLTRSLAAIRQPLPVSLSLWWGQLDWGAAGGEGMLSDLKSFPTAER